MTFCFWGTLETTFSGQFRLSVVRGVAYCKSTFICEWIFSQIHISTVYNFVPYFREYWEWAEHENEFSPNSLILLARLWPLSPFCQKILSCILNRKAAIQQWRRCGCQPRDCRCLFVHKMAKSQERLCSENGIIISFIKWLVHCILNGATM